MAKKIISFIACIFLLVAWAVPSFGQFSAQRTPPGFKFASSDRLPVIAMPAINTDSMLAEDAVVERDKGAPYRFGYNHLVYYKPENSGTWTNLPNGDRIWQLDVKTPGSFSVNLGFTGFNLPVGSKLFVYSKDHSQVLGPYTSANNTPDKFFGTELIRGDEAVVEYYEPAAVHGQNSFILFRITQGYKDLLKSLTGDFGAAGSCIHNINCPQYAQYWTQKRAVVCVIGSDGDALCSGSLINNTLSDGTPYILTANHCGAASGQWVFFFNWEAPGCAEPTSAPNDTQTIHGGATVAQSGVSDFNLVLMDGTPPQSYHPFYAGWSLSQTPATSVFGIHHPEGDVKKCSRADNAVTDTFYDAGNGVALVWQIGQWTDGCTEEGSSGSPLFDQNKRIVGQLYGGPSNCGEAADELRDYYGRFNVSWDSGSTPQTRLKDWLDPNNIDTLTNDGYDPYPVIDTLDFAILNLYPNGTISCQNTIQPKIWVGNVGTTAIDSFTVNYHINSGANITEEGPGIQISDSVFMQLSPITCPIGQDTLYVTISSPNGFTAQNPYNDSAIRTFIILPSTTVNPPIVQGFESGIFPPTGWNVTTPPSSNTWVLSTYGAYGQSSFSASVNEFSPSTTTAGETPQLITPVVNMTNAMNPAYLKFDVAYSVSIAGFDDSLAVLVSTDCGTSWTIIYQKGGDSLATAPDSNELFIPAASQWRTDSVNISSLVGQSSVLFDFEVKSGWGNAVYLDNINIADTFNSLGINPVADEMAVRVFPNPFTDNFNLQFTLGGAQNIDAALYSVDDKKLVTVLNNQLMDAGTHQLEINTQQLSNGLYILKVNNRFFKIEKMK